MTSICERKELVKASLEGFTNQNERLKYIIKLGKQTPPMNETFKIDQFLVAGCISKAWLAPEFRNDRIFFHVDSEAMIVKGIMSIILSVFNDSKPSEILEDDGTFLAQLGIPELLSMNRRNSSTNIMKLVRYYASAASQINSEHQPS